MEYMMSCIALGSVIVLSDENIVNLLTVRKSDAWHSYLLRVHISNLL